MTSIKVLKHFYELLNQAAGDAMCDALAVCAILTIKNWSLREWKARYNNVPNMLEKVKVVDRNIFKTANFDTELCEPVNAKDFIETSVRETPGGRCFVR